MWKNGKLNYTNKFQNKVLFKTIYFAIQNKDELHEHFYFARASFIFFNLTVTNAVTNARRYGHMRVDLTKIIVYTLYRCHFQSFIL
jgi:hypothetical protein